MLLKSVSNGIVIMIDLRVHANLITVSKDLTYAFKILHQHQDLILGKIICFKISFITVLLKTFKSRFANKYIFNGTEYRTLFKAFGLRIIITVTGNSGKFSIIPVYCN